MLFHLVKKFLAPGKCSEISRLISELLPVPHSPKPIRYSPCIQVLNSRKVGLKKGLRCIFRNW